MTRSSFPDDLDMIRRPAPVEELPLFGGASFPTAPAVTTAEQRALELPGSLDADYAAWRTSGGGQAIIERILARAMKMYAAGATRIGCKDLIERERWENKVAINNLLTSRIARTLVEMRPELGKLIQLRRLSSSAGVSE